MADDNNFNGAPAQNEDIAYGNAENANSFPAFLLQRVDALLALQSDTDRRSEMQHWEDHDEYNARKKETGLCLIDRWTNVANRDDKSVMSVDTEDSWDVAPEYQDVRRVTEMWPSWEKQSSQLRQKRYRERHSDYVAKLEAAGKVLSFTKFGQLPSGLRERIWELHCPEIRRSQRVLQVALISNGYIPPNIDTVYATKSTRELMRICHETRALGERYMPDTLNVAIAKNTDGILRYNAQNDIIHFFGETNYGLEDVKRVLDEQKASDDKTIKSKMKANRLASPHTSVRNIAIRDVEIRKREPGTYYDRFYDDIQTEIIRPEDASHRAPKELHPPGYIDALEYLFPNLENVYVLEYGGPRRIDRWIGHDRSYERHHIRTMKFQDSGAKEPIVYLYCWHGPPNGFRGRQALPVDSEVAHGGNGAEETPANDEAEADDGDFEDDCIINHFASLRNKGVRFSRMLFFEHHTGMEDYYRLRELTCPDGTWPDNDNGRPAQDKMPSALEGSRRIVEDVDVASDGDFDDEDESGSGWESDSGDFGSDWDDSDNSESPNRRHLETHDIYDNRWSENAEDRYRRRHKRGRRYNKSVLSDDTDDSWDERVNSNHRTGENDILLTHENIASIRRQQCYRQEHAAYVAKLKAAGKVLTFTKFGQLPPELRLRIWELHCPTLRRSQRVLHLALLPDGFVLPEESLSHQTRSTRELMCICKETRALGERYMPDTLRYVDRAGTLRYNAQRDIIYFTGRTTWVMHDVKDFLDKQKLLDGSGEKTKSNMTTTKKGKNKIRVASPHTSIRNLAIRDYERRERDPGTYSDRDNGRRVTKTIRPEDASHRAPRELLPYGWTDEMDYMFPNIENVYVMESGGPRKIDRWIGHDRSYERHHIRTIETEDSLYSYKTFRIPREYLYCWHAPPKGFRGRQALPANSEAAPGGDGAEASPVEDKAEVDDGDFKDDCIINHLARLRNKGVRFSRMLSFVWTAGMEDYYRLRSLTCPDGTWPNDDNGRPKPDEILRVEHDNHDSDGSDEQWSDDSYFGRDEDDSGNEDDSDE